MASMSPLAAADEASAIVLVVRFHRKVADFMGIARLALGVRGRLGRFHVLVGMLVIARPDGLASQVDEQAQ
jgi:hypothetical protein